LSIYVNLREHGGKFKHGVLMKILFIVLIVVAVIGLLIWLILRSAAKDADNDY